MAWTKVYGICQRVSMMTWLTFLIRLGAIARNTTWHETYSKYEVGKRNGANEKVIEKELVQANIELKTLR